MTVLIDISLSHHGNAFARKLTLFLFFPRTAKGLPEEVRFCAVKNQTSTSVLLTCDAGDSGGLRQMFILEVFDESQKLLANMTAHGAPDFHIQALPSDERFTLNVYAANAKGRSSSNLLYANTQKATKKQTPQKSNMHCKVAHIKQDTHLTHPLLLPLFV